MANINWTRHSYKSQLDRDYFYNPKQGFDKAWHERNKKKKQAQEQTKLQEQRKKIQALRNK